MQFASTLIAAIYLSVVESLDYKKQACVSERDKTSFVPIHEQDVEFHMHLQVVTQKLITWKRGNILFAVDAAVYLTNFYNANNIPNYSCRCCIKGFMNFY